MKLAKFEKKLFKDLNPNELVLWVGEPKPTFSVSLWNTITFEGASFFPIVVSAGMNVLGPMFFVLTIFSFYFGLWLMGLIWLFVLLLPDFVKHFRKRYTKYAITNQRIIIQLWWWGFRSFNSINLKRIVKIQYEDFAGNNGPITFFMSGDHDFWTRDFISSEESVYPTFERIQKVETVYKHIVKIFKLYDIHIKMTYKK